MNLDIIWLILVVLLWIPMVYAGKSFATWVPMRTGDLKRVFKILDLKSGENFYDLGCGNGKVVMYAGKNFPVQATGVEIVWPLYIWCQIKKLLSGQKNVQFKFGNLFKVDMSNANAVYVFGMPRTVKGKIKEKFLKELPPGARVLSYVFRIDGWTPTVHDSPGTNHNLPIFLYEIDKQRLKS